MIESQGVTSAAVPVGRRDDREYHAFLEAVQRQFEGLAGPIFRASVPGAALWDRYVQGFADAHERQHHTCSACRQFVEQYGGLAVVGDDGRLAAALWTPEVIGGAPASQRPGLRAMADAIASSTIAGLFLTSRPELGKRLTGAWQHLALAIPAARQHDGRVRTAFQRAAERAEEYQTVSRVLGEFTIEQFATVVAICQSEALYRSEKILGQAEWLHALKAKAEAAPKRWRAHLVWQAVALAPSGFCHPRSSMVGTVLEDVAAGLSFEAIKRNFDAKMHPLRYQRPQAAPSAGTIAQAEALVATLGIASSLQRRYATPADVTVFEWQAPAPVTAPPSGSVFGHLAAKGSTPAAPLVIPGKPITWRKFAADILPAATRLQVNLPVRGNYVTLTTAADAEAPPILQWDRESARNPVAWYLWHGGSSASQYGLSAGWADVAGITPLPCHWSPEVPATHQAPGRVFLVRGGKDTRQAGAALFPETLRNELHGVRSVIEAFSQRGTLAEVDGEHAMGLLFSEGQPVSVRVHAHGVATEYVLDRWE